jgi:hypothetical protein
MGILRRPEWRKISRCYEIRGDLEHEDAEYEAEIDDVIYIFKNCIEIVLSKDPVELIRVDDIKELVSAPENPIVSTEILEEFDKTPNPRQHEILEHLIHTALDSSKPDILRQNAMELLRQFRPLIKKQVLVDISSHLQEMYKKKPLNLLVAKVAYASGAFPYLKQRKVYDFFESFYNELDSIGHHWKQHDEHREPLENFEDVGGFMNCPTKPREKIVLWMVKCYIGERGGYGMGQNRKVFYSNSAARRIEEMFKRAGPLIIEDFKNAKKNKDVKNVTKYIPIARRLEQLEDILSTSNP